MRTEGKAYQLVQDLRVIKKIVENIHPEAANPYTLLPTLSEKLKWFRLLDLKNAFFCIPLSTESQELFAFEWKNPNREITPPYLEINGQKNWRNGKIRTLLEPRYSVQMTFS